MDLRIDCKFLSPRTFESLMKNIITLILVAFSTFTFAQTPLLKDVKGKAVGDTIANFSATTKDNGTYTLSDDLSSGATVVIFIRGYWCGYCNKHMSHLQDSFSQITEAGANIVVVSPEKPEFLEKTAEKSGVEFTLLYDSAYTIMNQFDVLWAPDEAMEAKLKKYLGNELKQSHSDDTQRLPVPATYIIGQDGVVTWRHFDTDYSKRSTVREILSNL